MKKRWAIAFLFFLNGVVLGDAAPVSPAESLPQPPTVAVAAPVAPVVVAASLPPVTLPATPLPDAAMPAAPVALPTPAAPSTALPVTPADSHTSAPAQPEVDAALPFVEPASNGPDSAQRKDMFEKTAEDEHKAQQSLAAIEEQKNERLTAYLAFDQELRALEEEVGAARGDASGELERAREALLDEIKPGHTQDMQAEMAINQQSKLLTDLAEAVRQLREEEAAIVAAVKSLSDHVLEVGDMVVQVGSWRFEMSTVLEQAVAADLLNKIKEMGAKVAAAQAALTLPASKAAAVDEALKKGKERMSAVRTILSEVQQKKAVVSEIAKKVPAAVPAVPLDTPVTEPAASTAAVSQEDVAKKKNKQAPSGFHALVKGTAFEKPYRLAQDGLAASWTLLSAIGQSVRDMWHTFQQTPPEAADGVEKLEDPVLERIRLERHQSVQRRQGLAAQRELIAMKDALLDRLEAERMMQLDTTEKVHAELTRAYDRHDRELSWVELGKRFVWKTYAAVRRAGNRLMAWWRGDTIKRGPARAKGIGEEKSEPA